MDTPPADRAAATRVLLQKTRGTLFLVQNANRRWSVRMQRGICCGLSAANVEKQIPRGKTGVMWEYREHNTSLRGFMGF